MDPQTATDVTRSWIPFMVIGLNPRPFAQRVFQANQIRYSVADAEDEHPFLESIANGLIALANFSIS